MPDTLLTKKLLIKPGQRIAVLNPPAGYLDLLALPEGVQLADEPEGQYDLVHLFVKDLEELERLAPAAISTVKPDGVFWVSYPKQASKVKTDINRGHRLGGDVQARRAPGDPDLRRRSLVSAALPAHRGGGKGEGKRLGLPP